MELPERTLSLLRLTLTPGLGPVLIARLLAALGDPREVLRAPPAIIEKIPGIGPDRAAALRDPGVERAVPEELGLARSLGARFVALGEAAYPPLLAQIPDPPPLLCVRGTLEPAGTDRYCVGLVGSRACSAYGLEQARRFGGVLASAGLTIVSGAARGIDTSAHRGALAAGGRTIAVLGCGLAHAYPPENAPLLDEIASEGKGAVVSELPLRTPPAAANFPARNRIISGISLGVIVVEAARASGALITARMAAEDHGREVFAIPGRVDSPASQGTHELIKAGGAVMITEPGDVLEALETPARHSFRGTHAARYTPAEIASPPPTPAAAGPGPGDPLLAALAEPRTLDALVELSGLPAAAVRARLTVLEIQRRVTRSGGTWLAR